MFQHCFFLCTLLCGIFLTHAEPSTFLHPAEPCPPGSGLCTLLKTYTDLHIPFNISVDDGAQPFFLRVGIIPADPCAPDIGFPGCDGLVGTAPQGALFETIYTPFALGAIGPNVYPPYHFNATSGRPQIIGQNYGTCQTESGGYTSSGFNGQFVCYSEFVFYDDRFFNNCNLLQGTSPITGTYNVSGTYNWSGNSTIGPCPICVSPDETCNNLGTGMVLGKIFAKVRYPRYRPYDTPITYIEEFSISGGTGIFREIVRDGAYGRLILNRSYLPLTYELHL